MTARRPRDYQRQRIYNWEREFLCWENYPEMTLDECQALVDRVFWEAGMDRDPDVRVKDGRGRRIACWQERMNNGACVF